MQLGIAIHVAAVVGTDGRIFGDGANVPARIEGLTEPGGILVTRRVRHHVRDRVDHGFDDLGERSVKNIARPLRVFRVVFDQRAPSAPGSTPAEGDGAASKAVELAFWRSVEAGGNAAEYGAYLERYPEGSFAPLARARLAGGPEAGCRDWAEIRDQASGAPPPAPCRPSVVLVVENDPLVRALVVDVLEEAGFEVIEAPSADYAVLVLEKRADVRVVFTDVEMPGMLDGIQLARMIQHRHRQVGVIVGSGRERPRPGDIAPEIAFLAKPYAPAALVDAIRKLGA